MPKRNPFESVERKRRIAVLYISTLPVASVACPRPFYFQKPGKGQKSVVLKTTCVDVCGVVASKTVAIFNGITYDLPEVLECTGFATELGTVSIKLIHRNGSTSHIYLHTDRFTVKGHTLDRVHETAQRVSTISGAVGL